MKGTKLLKIYLWISVNNTAPFVSITWHQAELLGCAVYSHCPTHDSHNKCIHGCRCLSCIYVTKPCRILQKSQKVYVSFGQAKVDTFSLTKVCAKFYFDRKHLENRLNREWWHFGALFFKEVSFSVSTGCCPNFLDKDLDLFLNFQV